MQECRKRLKTEVRFPVLCLCIAVTVLFFVSVLFSWFRYLAVTLVINWLSSYDDPILQRMAVAVISTLVAKVKTPLTYYVLSCRMKI